MMTMESKDEKFVGTSFHLAIYRMYIRAYFEDMFDQRNKMSVGI